MASTKTRTSMPKLKMRTIIWHPRCCIEVRHGEKRQMQAFSEEGLPTSTEVAREVSHANEESTGSASG
jgi:hypothetical protein